jgi:hypothetical protein
MMEGLIRRIGDGIGHTLDISPFGLKESMGVPDGMVNQLMIAGA